MTFYVLFSKGKCSIICLWVVCLSRVVSQWECQDTSGTIIHTRAHDWLKTDKVHQIRENNNRFSWAVLGTLKRTRICFSVLLKTTKNTLALLSCELRSALCSINKKSTVLIFIAKLGFAPPFMVHDPWVAYVTVLVCLFVFVSKLEGLNLKEIESDSKTIFS